MTELCATCPFASWRPIQSAPKSPFRGSHIQGVYLLGYCPDESLSPEACIEVIWWEPHTRGADGKLGCWYGSSAIEVRPTHWMPLPRPPASKPSQAS